MPQKLSDRNRLVLLIVIMAGIAISVGIISIWVVYRAAFAEERARLIELAQSQARMIEAIARYETSHRSDRPEDAAATTLRQVVDAHERYQGFGETGEFTLARRVGDEIVFLLSHRHFDLDTPKPVPWASAIAEPMRRALSGRSGSVLGLDYRGATVLAAYEPVAVLNFGIVAKIDMAEIRAPFIRAGMVSAGGALLVVLLGALLLQRVSAPFVERTRAEKALEASEERLRDALESAAEGFILYDADERLVLCDSTYRDFYRQLADLLVPGARMEDLIRASLEYGIFDDGGDPEEWIRLRLEQYRSPPNMHVQQLTDGRWIEAREYRTRDGGVFGVRTDITERRRTEDQLRQAQKMEAIGQLTGGIAHDFNNILAIVLGNLEILTEQLAGNAKARRLAQKGIDAAERAALLTQRLLAFSRKQPLRPQVTNPVKLVGAMLDILHRTLGETVEVETAFTGRPWLTEVDPAQLENAVLNLAINARDAMPKGGKLTIEVANIRLDDDYAAAQADVTPGQYVMLAVTDTGSGMPDEVRAHAFEPFYTTKDVGAGSGLGLSMVYGFVKQSGGHVSIYSEEGEGTTVKLYLPRVKQGKTDKTATAVAAGAQMGRGEKILVVEDDPDLLTLLVTILHDLGYDVLEASHGKAALDLLAQEKGINLLLTDVVLPEGMNGAELAAEARRLYPGLPVLYMSGYAEDAIIHHGRLEDGAQLLSKPFRKNDLARMVRQALEKGSI